MLPAIYAFVQQHKGPIRDVPMELSQDRSREEEQKQGGKMRKDIRWKQSCLEETEDHSMW